MKVKQIVDVFCTTPRNDNNKLIFA